MAEGAWPLSFPSYLTERKGERRGDSCAILLVQVQVSYRVAQKDLAGDFLIPMQPANCAIVVNVVSSKGDVVHQGSIGRHRLVSHDHCPTSKKKESNGRRKMADEAVEQTVSQISSRLGACGDVKMMRI